MTIVCLCEKNLPCQIHPKFEKNEPLPNTAKDVVPQIDPIDKLTLRTLENESLKAQIQAEQLRRQAMIQQQNAFQQLEQFSAAMFEKHGMKQSEWILDMQKLEFVPRAPEKP